MPGRPFFETWLQAGVSTIGLMAHGRMDDGSSEVGVSPVPGDGGFKR